MKTTKKSVIRNMPSESKSAAQIAAELEQEGKRLLEVAKILKKGRPTKK